MQAQPQPTTSPRKATPEPTLAFNRQLDRWECETSDVFVYMSNETFQSYIVGYLECLGIEGAPTTEQYVDAAKRCRRLAYFDKCPDPKVHRVPPTMPSKFWKESPT